LIAKLPSANEEFEKAFSTKNELVHYEVIRFFNSKKINDLIQNDLKLLDESERKKS
jgi:hypothetical protein